MRPHQICIHHYDIRTLPLAVRQPDAIRSSRSIASHSRNWGGEVVLSSVGLGNIHKGLDDFVKAADRVPLESPSASIPSVKECSRCLRKFQSIVINWSGVSQHNKVARWANVYVPGESNGELPRYLERC